MLTVRPVPRPSTVPPGYSVYPCCLCGVAIAVDDHSPEAPTCRACLRLGAESAAHEAMCILRELRAGTGVFAVLTPAERAEQIVLLIGPVPAPVLVKAAMRNASNDELIRVIAETGDVVLLGAATAELAKRLPVSFGQPVYTSTPDDAPSPAERDEIESRIEVVADGDFLDGERFDGLS